MSDIDYSFIDYKQNIPTPPPMKNAGLYTGEVSFSKKPWGNDYSQPHVSPDATEYAKQFYAKHIIPSTNRPGNNYFNSDMFKYYDSNQYNFKCYKPY